MWELDYKEGWVQKNWCFWTVVLEKTLESPLDWKEIWLVHPKGNRSWVFIGRLKAGDGDNRGWNGWMASPTQWTWVWVNSRSWWWTVRPCMLRFMGSQRVGHDWATELNWTELKHTSKFLYDGASGGLLFSSAPFTACALLNSICQSHFHRTDIKRENCMQAIVCLSYEIKTLALASLTSHESQEFESGVND